MRVTMMYGWNNPSERSNTVTWIIESAKNGKQITLANDRFTNPVWNYEVAKSIKSVIEKNLCGCFHVAGLNTLNRYEIAQAVCKEFDLDSKYIKANNTCIFIKFRDTDFKRNTRYLKYGRENSPNTYQF